MATPSLAMIPSAIADAKVFSVLPNNGDGDFTFNRDSSATRVGQNGLIQTVGYFGSELVTNGDFATDSDWTKGAGWTIGSGVASSDGTQAATSALYQDCGIVLGKQYQVVYDVTSYTAGSVRTYLGGTSTGSVSRSATGTYTQQFSALGNQWVTLEADANFIGSIDNVSVKEVTGDQPRLNYDISNGVVQSCPSLLLEPASTNLITYSEAFASWSKINLTSADNFGISPDGTKNAAKLTEGSGTSTQYRCSIGVSSASAIHTFSCYVKRISGTRTAYVDLGIITGFFNFDTKSIYSATGTASFEDAGNGWYRIRLSHITAATAAAYVGFGNGNTETYTSTGGAEILFWGMQIEALSYATSYIPTSGASQTRAAESCLKTGLTNYIGQTEGTLFCEISGESLQENSRYMSISVFNDPNKRLTIYQSGSVTRLINAYCSAGATFNLQYNPPSGRLKIALGYKSGDYVLYVNGVNAATSTESAVVACSDLGLGVNEYLGTANPPSVGYSQVLLYNTRLTNAQLQTLTTL